MIFLFCIIRSNVECLLTGAVETGARVSAAYLIVSTALTDQRLLTTLRDFIITESLFRPKNDEVVIQKIQ